MLGLKVYLADLRCNIMGDKLLLNFGANPDLKFLCIQIQKLKAKPFLLSNWYRPPNTPIELFDKFEVLLGKIKAENIVSKGDINCDMMAISPANETRHLIELCES